MRPAAHPRAVPPDDAAITPTRIVIAVVEGRIVIEPRTDPADAPSRPSPGHAAAAPAAPPCHAAAARAAPPCHAAAARAAPGDSPRLHDDRVTDCRRAQACRIE